MLDFVYHPQPGNLDPRDRWVVNLGDIRQQRRPLAYKRIPFLIKMADDSGSGARTDLASWRPELDVGWFYLGQSPSDNWDSAPTGIIIQPLEPDALREIVAWERVWDDAGSGKRRDYSLWRGVPPSIDYVVVGGIFSTNPGHAEPDHQQKHGIMAIRRDLVVPDNTSNVWTDAGSKAKKDGSVWKTMGTGGHISPNSLIPMLSHNAPPRGQSFSLNKEMVVELNLAIDSA
ncbi:FDS protein [Mycena capillaripes]|nr:FDS protein [Mycena capillaripes]